MNLKFGNHTCMPAYTAAFATVENNSRGDTPCGVHACGCKSFATGATASSHILCARPRSHCDPGRDPESVPRRAKDVQFRVACSLYLLKLARFV